MMPFWIITAAMILAALAILAPSLLRKRQADTMDRARQNVVIARERLAELEHELAQGILTGAQFEKTKSELEQSLLMDLDAPGPEGAFAETIGGSRWLTLGSLVVLVPALTVGLYAYLGSPQLLEPDREAVHAGAAPGEMPAVEDMVAALINRLGEAPEDPEGWFLLGRTYMTMKAYSKAASAFEKVQQLVGDQPVVLLSWADAAAMSQRGDLAGLPAELIRKAIGLAPDNSTALWLAGMVEEQDGNHLQAIAYWERLAPQVEDDPESRSQVASLIARARQRAGLPSEAGESVTSVAATPGQGPPSGGISVRISLSPELQGRVGPEENLFIYAKALQGPRMPLAAARRQVRDLPLELSLDDSSAMMPAMKLSNFQQVVVGARISRSGDPIARSGDLTGEVSPVVVGNGERVEIVIDKVVP